MSKAQRIAKLKEVIRNLIVKELEESSTTASAGAANASGTGIYYDTPMAFSGKSKKSKKKKKKIAHAAGMTPVKESVIKEYVTIANFNRDFDIAMNLVIKQANNLKGALAKHPIKRNVNKLKAVLNMYKKFIAPALVKADRDISKGFDLTRIKKDLADGKFKSTLEYQIMNRIGGRSYDSNEFYGIDDKVKKLLDRMHSELRKLVNIMDKAQLESVNEAVQFILKKDGKTVSTIETNPRLHKGMHDMIRHSSRGNVVFPKESRAEKYLNGALESVEYEAKSNIVDIKNDLETFKKMLKRIKIVKNESVNEGRYHDWRNDESMTPKQKVGRSMREIRDALNELDKTVKMNLKLKTELNMKSEDYWKNTHKALTKISERLVKMANKIGNLK